MRTSIFLTAAAVAVLTLSGCSRLSHEAKEIVGTYYNTELSQTEPVMELRKDATCVLRAIKPGVLTFSVDGSWNVEDDSLLIDLKPATIKYEGDSTLIGDIPSHIAQKIVSYNEFSLQLETDGINYLYQRRK